MLSSEDEKKIIDNRYLPTRLILRRYQISQMSLHRWLNHPTMKFPKPVFFSGRKFWLASEIEAWELARLRDRSAA